MSCSTPLYAIKTTHSHKGKHLQDVAQLQPKTPTVQFPVVNMLFYDVRILVRLHPLPEMEGFSHLPALLFISV